MEYRSRFRTRASLLAVLVFVGGMLLPSLARADTDPFVWGANGAGLAGLSDSSRSVTAPILAPRLAGLHDLAVNDTNAAALREDGEAVAWGMTGDPEGPEYTSVPVRLGMGVAVVAANGNALVVREDGTVVSVPVIGNAKAKPVAGLTGVTAIAVGSFHFLALHEDGTVSAWGDNRSGQLGDGTTVRRTTPQKAPGLTGVAAIAAGGNESLALLDDGTVKAWGQVPGDMTSTPVPSPTAIPGLSDISRISTSGGQVLALDTGGTVFAWGWNTYGQLCDGTAATRTTPQPIPDLPPVTAIAAGSAHSLILLGDGQVLGCGDNRSGELGRPGTDSLAEPTPVPGMTATETIAAGSSVSYGFRDATAPTGTVRIGTDRSGDTAGTIEGSGIYCGGGWSCSGTWPVGAMLTFTADGGRRANLDSWSGICTGSGACEPTVESDGTLKARFVMKPWARVAPDTRRLGRAIFPRIGKARLFVKAWGPSQDVFNTRLQCRLKRNSARDTTGWKRFRRCQNNGWPIVLKGLKTGRYTMVVRAVNRFGTDRSPERIHFRIKRAARR